MLIFPSFSWFYYCFKTKISLMRRIRWGRCDPFWIVASKLQKMMTELIKSIIKFWQTILIFPSFSWFYYCFKTKISQISDCVSAKNLIDEEDTLRSLRSILECSYQIAKNDDWAHEINNQILTNNANFFSLFMISLLLQNKNLTYLPLCFSQKSCWWGGYVEVAAIHSRV